jgi:hypothetical protein
MDTAMGDGICQVGAIDHGIWIVEVCFIVFSVNLGEFTLGLADSWWGIDGRIDGGDIAVINGVAGGVGGR